ncbi:MAG: hypothetical protein C4334_04400 [Pyrinomonas sp.]|uniref:hypothetical protein n=1 Tax=Pyrinomonas sp. TaxID=2080306 RepID=UPI00331EE524
MNEWEWELIEAKAPLDSLSVLGVEVRPGDRVRLQPQRSADVFDLALAGKTAIIEAIEQDYDGRVLVAVVVEDDPGCDLGLLRQPGHRFFFSPEEIEPLGL